MTTASHVRNTTWKGLLTSHLLGLRHVATSRIATHQAKWQDIPLVSRSLAEAFKSYIFHIHCYYYLIVSRMSRPNK